VTAATVLSESEEIACRDFVEGATAYLERRMGAVEVGWFEEHEIVCEGCAKYAYQMRRTVRVLANLSGRPASSSRRAAARRSTDRGAARGPVTKAYKFLKVVRPGSGRKRLLGPFSGFEWRRGTWERPPETPSPCLAGVHACTARDLPYWLSDELWIVDLEGDVQELDRKLLAPGGRLDRRVDSWTARTAMEFAEDCARRVQASAVEVMRRSGLDRDADRIAAASLSALPAKRRSAALRNVDLAEALFEYAREAARGLGGVGTAVGGAPPTDPRYPASTAAARGAAAAAWVAAIAAGRVAGTAGREAERREQAAWLIRRLGLDG
jgi:hypothetical protein